MSATVPTAAVTPTVTEVPLTGAAAASPCSAGAPSPALPARVVSTPQAVDGYAAVGVTWERGEELEEDEITLRVRTRTGDEWSGWEELEYHDEHGPDPGSAEGAGARPGTEPMFVGDVDDVQVEARTDGVTLPDDLSLALVDPGSATEDPDRGVRLTRRDRDPSEWYEQEYAEEAGSTLPSDAHHAAGRARRRAAHHLLARPVGR